MLSLARKLSPREQLAGAMIPTRLLMREPHIERSFEQLCSALSTAKLWLEQLEDGRSAEHGD
jgi:hypothetical protein